ncbi:MAG TPA: penicillin-insensitive murein endopeptidase [Candidatus Limnocylindrales bacterium]|nr:penicillin-insensitive murein endopeptidase [Candidatus Limnocylindrales bacterium]
MARPRPSRPALAAALLATLGLVALVAAPAFAAIRGSYPVQSAGDRGTDVFALQELVRYHHDLASGTGQAGSRGVTTGARNAPDVPVNGIFGASTTIAVRAFQSNRGLSPTGIADDATWAAIVVAIGPGSTGGPVRALQRELREKRGATNVPIDGVYGATTTSAVKAFQAHMGLAQTGRTDAATWKALIWHYELPTFSASALCDYDPPANANWGTAELISTLEAAGKVMVQSGYGRIPVGDLGYEHGGDHPEHRTHEVGLDADIRMMRKANDQCSTPSNWRLAAYDRDATRQLVLAIRAATPGHVKEILFNDPQLIAEGLTVFRADHDDHLHVRLCEAAHALPLYTCP